MSSDNLFPFGDHGTQGDTSPSKSSYNVNSKIMIVAIAVLFGVVFFILGLHMYAKWFWRNNGGLHGGGSVGRWRRRRRLQFTAARRTRAGQVGLDDAVKESLPTFVFNSEKATADRMECAVCLEEFGDGEKGRLLPKCNHSFHIDCIDMWFQSNSTCPLCRCSVAPDLPLEPPHSEPTVLLREGPHSLIAVPSYQDHDGNYRFSEDLPPSSVSNFLDDQEAGQGVSGNRQVHRIFDSSAPSLAAEELSSSKRRSSVDFSAKAIPMMQYPSNVLFWGNTSQVNVGYGAPQEENVTRQISAAGIHAQPSCLVIEIPRVPTASQVVAVDETSCLSDTGGSKSPIGRLVTSSFRRLMSIRKGGTVSPGPEGNSPCVGNDCEQGEAVTPPATATRQS